MSKPFRFKQFSVIQEKAAMKIGTDSVLLGAWAKLSKAKTILDIGTGTGVIALICAQRNREAKITAIEIEQNAAVEARENFLNSPWTNRLQLIKISLQEYSKVNKKFDHIVCNPPYFEVHKKVNHSERKVARQRLHLSLEELSHSARILLSNKGQFSMIYPYNEAEQVEGEFEKNGFYLQRRMNVKGRIGVKPKRVLLAFGREKQLVDIQELIIEPHQRHQYSKEFIELTKELYWKI